MTNHTRVSVATRATATLLMAVLAGPPLALAALADSQRQADPSQQQQQQQQQPETPAPVAIAGKWTMSLDMAMGVASIALELKQEAEKITGTYTGSYGTFPLEGVLKGRALEFGVYLTIEDQQMTMWFTGEVAEDLQSMRGGATLGEMGEATWSAKPAR